MYLHFLQTFILKFQEKHQITYPFKPDKTFDRKLPKLTTTTNKKKKKKKTLNLLTIRVDYERINGRYINAEYRRKITRCDLTLNIKYRPVRRVGRGGGRGVGCIPHPSCANYFKIMQIFTRN